MVSGVGAVYFCSIRYMFRGCSSQHHTSWARGPHRVTLMNEIIKFEADTEGQTSTHQRTSCENVKKMGQERAQRALMFVTLPAHRTLSTGCLQR